MEWNDWEIFCCVVEVGSFIVVVEVLGIFKLIVSVVVLRLEVVLGVWFMMCMMCQLWLIEVGLQFYDDIVLLFECLCEVYVDIIVVSEIVVGMLCIVVLYEVGVQYLIELVCCMFEKYLYL